jgi:stage II sporulation protein D
MVRLRRLVLSTLGVLAAAPAAAQAAPTFVVNGAGFGHGVGMSQYGAFGYASKGYTHEQILRAYYTGTTLGTVSPRPTVRVLLQSGRGGYSVQGVTRAGEDRLDPQLAYTVSRAGVTRDGRKVSASPVVSAPAGGSFVLKGTSVPGVRNGRYRGALDVSDGLAVNEVALEDYVRGVVARESPASWPQEALQAQAVAARTYAITTRKSGTFDHYADVRSQVYGGVGAETPTTDAAVRATDGQVVMQGGKPVTTYFFSTSGGHTEDVQNSFLGSLELPWLKGVTDPFDDASPRHRWRIAMSLSSAAAKLRGLYVGTFRGISVVSRGTSPRIVQARVLGTGGNRVTTGPELRRRLGLYDTWANFTVKRKASQRERPAPAVAARARAAGRPDVGRPAARPERG